MSDPTTHVASENKPRGIILVEPYDALGIAISSALRKFASLYQVRVVTDLAEAEVATANLRPELFVLDLDPAPNNEVSFFSWLREQHPDARALVIAATSSRELRAIRGTAGAIQFIEKPFDLGAFGATVQALLGPWTTPFAGGGRGTLRDLQALDVVQLKCLERRSGILRVETVSGNGEIHFHHGEISHAATGALGGLAALEEIVSWPGGYFFEEPLPEHWPKTIDGPWQSLLFDCFEKAKRRSPGSLGKSAPTPPGGAEINSLGEVVPGENGAPPATQQTGTRGKRILVVDDTEMLRIFAVDVLRTEDPTFEITTAASGKEGLQLATSDPPDLLLLDFSLNDLNGDEVCRALLESERTAGIPVLMMSGHLPELVQARATFRNIVDTLPKPFLSGALINAVEKIFATERIPEPPSPPASEPIEKTEPPAIAVPPAAASTNGHGPHDNDDSAPAPPTPTATLAAAPPEMDAPHASRQPLFEQPATVETEHRELIAILACEVISVQLAPDFRMGALQLKPAEAGVVLRMNRGGELANHPPKDFRLGIVQLNEHGTIARLRLVSAAPAEHPSANGLGFVVDEVSAPANGDERLVQLTGAQDAVMRVKLIAEFELLRVELSDTFAVDAVVLRPRSNSVQVQTGENSAVAMQFYIHEVLLDENGQLASLRLASR